MPNTATRMHSSSPCSSPARSVIVHREQQRAKFHLPVQAKAILFLALTGAVASIGRLEMVFQREYFSSMEERFLRTKAMMAVATKKYPYASSRVVFLHGPPWSTNKTIPLADPSVEYAVEHRGAVNKSDTTPVDLTRLYPVGDSKDFPDMERRKWPRHEFDPHCVPSAQWQSGFYPVCNEIHAVADLRQALLAEELTLLSKKGFWRHAWRHDKRGSGNVTDPASTTVWKTFKIHHNFEEKYYEDNRVDAVAMERLTGSPYVIGMYGFCGLTVVQEFAGRELAAVVDANKLNSTERLQLARQITEGVAHIHGIPADDGRTDQPTLVHNDINLANLVFTADDRPVLNDFNIAILMMKHNETGKTCPFHSHFPNPQWKAPEEQVDSDAESHSKPPIVNEKIDIYALGNVLYRMIVGGSPWKRPEAKKLYPDEKIVVARLKRYNGTLPSVPEHIINATNDDPPLRFLLDAMRQCYRFRPMERPTAHELMDFLDQSLETAWLWEHEQAVIRAAAEELKAEKERNSTRTNSTLDTLLFENEPNIVPLVTDNNTSIVDHESNEIKEEE